MSNNLNLKLEITEQHTNLELSNIKSGELREVLEALTSAMNLTVCTDKVHIITNEKGQSNMKVDDTKNYVEIENNNYEEYLTTLNNKSDYSNKYNDYTKSVKRSYLVAVNCEGCGDTIVKRLSEDDDQVVHCNKCGEDTRISSTVRGRIKCHECGFEIRLSKVQTLDDDDIDLKCCKCKTKLVGKYHEVNHIYTEARY